MNGASAFDLEDSHAPAHSKLSAEENKKTLPELNVKSVVFGHRLLYPGHTARYRSDIVGSNTTVKRLFVCPSCFKYTVDGVSYLAHWAKCEQQDVPGHKIYESGAYSIHQVDGKDQWLFAQNISLFAKLFIEQKSVCYDVSGFLFYLLVKDESEDKTSRCVVGFFSKEKLSWDLNNLACIVVFPPWQKQGLGQLLMAASYNISKREGKIGGPEKPLSEMGRHSYTIYWSRAIANCILEHPANRALTVQEISDDTYIIIDDVIATLKQMGILGRSRSDGSFAISKDKIRTWLASQGFDGSELLDPDAFMDKSP